MVENKTDEGSLLSDAAPPPEEPGAEKTGTQEPSKDTPLPDFVKAFTVPLDERPEYLPENFYDPEKKHVRVGSMLKSLIDTQTQLRARPDPAAPPEKYEANISEELSKLIDGKISMDAESPIFKEASELAKKHKMSQEAFSDFLEFQAKQEMSRLIDTAEEKKDLETQWGDGFQSKVDGVTLFVKKYVKEGTALYDFATAVSSTSMGMQFIDALRGASAEKDIPPEAKKPSSTVTFAQIQERKRDPRYNVESATFDKNFWEETQRLLRQVKL